MKICFCSDQCGDSCDRDGAKHNRVARCGVIEVPEHHISAAYQKAGKIELMILPAFFILSLKNRYAGDFSESVCQIRENIGAAEIVMSTEEIGRIGSLLDCVDMPVYGQRR